mmetsp:Transcript_67782/g.151358  ORF Transcript_67782/g.151358 Transcript_67782/m.151358 type:complete len:213 (+) Transcript_67782:740-1378(+)
MPLASTSCARSTPSALTLPGCSVRLAAHPTTLTALCLRAACVPRRVGRERLRKGPRTRPLQRRGRPVRRQRQRRTRSPRRRMCSPPLSLAWRGSHPKELTVRGYSTASHAIVHACRVVSFLTRVVGPTGAHSKRPPRAPRPPPPPPLPPPPPRPHLRCNLPKKGAALSRPASLKAPRHRGAPSSSLSRIAAGASSSAQQSSSLSSRVPVSGG